MGPKKMHARDAETTRRAALDAAQHLFAEKGFSGTSMREIASASGISQPLIHYHFGSKEGLYRAVKERLMMEGLRSIRVGSDCSADTGADPSLFIRATYNSISGNEDLMRLVAWSQLERDSTPWPGEEEIHRAMAGHIQRHLPGIPSGKSVDPMIAAIIIEALTFFWSQHSHYYTHLFEEPAARLTDRFLDQITSLFFGDAAAHKDKG